MTCPAILTCSMYADGALTRAEAAAIEGHLTQCAACRTRIEGLRTERRAIHHALLTSETPGPVPAFLTPPTIPTLLVWLGWMALAGWAVSLAWSSAAAAGLPGWLGWLAPDVVGTGIQMLIGGALHLMLGGDGPVAGLIDAVGLPLLAGGALVIAWILTRRGQGPAAPTCLTLGLAVVLAGLAPAGHAFEIRRDESRVTVAAGETVDDTLIVMAETVLVEGTVTGDLIAMGERVTIRGEVGGLVIGMGNSVEVEGRVGGSVLTLGETVLYRGARVDGNVYGAGRRVELGNATTVTGNASVMGEETRVQGAVGRDLLAMARSVSVLGAVAGDMRAYAEEVDVAQQARIGGDLIATVEDPDQLRVHAAAVQGETVVDTRPPERHGYLSWQFYLGEVLKLIAAFICGLVLFRLFPGLGRARLDSGADVLTTAAIGALGLVAVPALAVACILTLIGAPVGILALLLWLVALYLAGIVTAAWLGRRLFDDAATRPALALLAGLAIVFVLVNVPFLGGLARLLVLLLGLGFIGQWLRGLWGGRATT